MSSYAWRFSRSDSGGGQTFVLTPQAPEVGTHTLRDRLEGLTDGLRLFQGAIDTLFLFRVILDGDGTPTIQWTADPIPAFRAWILDHADNLTRTVRAAGFLDVCEKLTATITELNDAAAAVTAAADALPETDKSLPYLRKLASAYEDEAFTLGEIAEAKVPALEASSAALSGLSPLTNAATVDAAKVAVTESEPPIISLLYSLGGVSITPSSYLPSSSYDDLLREAKRLLLSSYDVFPLRHRFVDDIAPVAQWLQWAGSALVTSTTTVDIVKVIKRRFEYSPQSQPLASELETKFMALAPDGYTEP